MLGVHLRPRNFRGKVMNIKISLSPAEQTAAIRIQWQTSRSFGLGLEQRL